MLTRIADHTINRIGDLLLWNIGELAQYRAAAWGPGRCRSLVHSQLRVYRSHRRKVCDNGSQTGRSIAMPRTRRGTGRKLMLNGKVATVTGIGLGIACSLAVEGCRVALNGLRASDEIEKLRDVITAARVPRSSSAVPT